MAVARGGKARAPQAQVQGLADLRERVEAGGPAAVYLLVGEDRDEMDRAIAFLEAIVAGDLGALNAVRLHGMEHSHEDVVAWCSTLPMLGGRRLAIVREPERLRGAPASLVAYVRDPCPSTTVVLVPTSLDRRLGWVKELEAAATMVSFPAPTERDLEAWVRRRLAATGIKLEPQALALLSDLVQANTLVLSHEIDKLALYCAGRGLATAEDVAAVLGRTRTIEVWSLTNAIEDADPPAAVAALRRLLEQGAAVPLLVGVLDWCLGRLVSAEPVRAFPARRDAIERRRTALRGQAEEAYAHLRAADRLFRTVGGNAEAALERAVLHAAEAGRTRGSRGEALNRRGRAPV